MVRRAESAMEAAEIFSWSFSGTFSTEPDVLPTLITHRTVESFCDVEFSPEQVERQLDQQGATTDPDGDGISSQVLRKTSSYVALPVSIIFS